MALHGETVKIEKVIFGGAGLARVGGKVCFVEKVLAGERVIVDVLEQRKNFSKARIRQVLEPSPHRVNPKCRHFGKCGGCQYQMMSYEEELRVKSEQVKDAFTRGLGLTESLVPTLQPSPSEYGTRNHMTLHFQEGVWGFFGRDNETIVPIEECPISDTRLKRAFLELPVRSKSERMTLWLDHAGHVHQSSDEALFQIEVLGQKLWAHPRGFFQNNLAVAAKMIETVKEWISEWNPGIFMDLFAGGGLFGLLAAEEVKERIFLEENPYSLEALKKNTERLGGSVQVLEGKTEKIFPDLSKKSDLSKALIFMDPPRDGLDAHFADSLSSMVSLGLIYVSCDLAILVRDLKRMLAGGKWEIARVAAFDMFPRTRHIETIVFLTPR